MSTLDKMKSGAHRAQRGVRRVSMTSIRSAPNARGGEGPRVLVTSLPKSGTHLLSAVLAEFPELAKYPGNRIDPSPPWSWLPGGDERVRLGVGRPRTVDRVRLRRFLAALRPGVLITGHVPHSPELAADLSDLGFRIIAMVRDPRDVVVSKVRFANSLPDGRRERERLRGESHERQISLATEGYSSDGTDDAVHIGDRLRRIVAWRRAGALVVRFEDLVGERGGGTAEAQLRTIGEIRSHIGLARDETIERAAADRSFGRSPTFRAGRSTGWREHLTAEQAARIEELSADVMHDLGYSQTGSTG